MLTSQRRNLILAELRQTGQVIAKKMAEEFSLSEDTIRRDLREMASEGLLRRVHGGALPLSPELPDFTARQTISSDEKQALGSAAVKLLKPGQTVFLDGGTSNAQIARALPRDMPLVVATHSPTIAAELEHHPLVEIILIGGRIYRHSMVATGTIAAAQVDLIRPDVFFLGVTAAHPLHGLSTGDFEEAAIKRHIASRSVATYVLLTADKLDAASPCTIMPVSDISGIIVRRDLSEETLSPYRAMAIEIIEAD